MKIILIALSFIFAGVLPAHAETPYEVGATVGLSVSDWESDVSGSNWDGKSGLILGATFYRTWGDTFGLRAGGYYVERKSDFRSAGATGEVSVKAVDVPITALFQVASGFGLFVGPQFSLAVSDSCDSSTASACDNFDAKTLTTALSLGASMRVHPNWAVEAFYNIAVSDIADDTKVNTAGVQAAFIY